MNETLGFWTTCFTHQRNYVLILDLTAIDYGKTASLFLLVKRLTNAVCGFTLVDLNLRGI
jgi:hypothetical protein